MLNMYSGSCVNQARLVHLVSVSFFTQLCIKKGSINKNSSKEENHNKKRSEKYFLSRVV